MPDTAFVHLDALARFDRAGMQKVDCRTSAHLFVGLNCLLPGQAQRVHAHAGADKFYLVLRGRATLVVGQERRVVGPGDMAWAPAGVPHAVDATDEETVLLVGMAPPPEDGRAQSEQSPSG
jgi:quercetin dioxygenase-like cupin family protein